MSAQEHMDHMDRGDNVKHLSEIREPIEIVIPCQSKLKKWAFDNAYTLIFLSIMFVITWVVEIASKLFS